MNLKAMNETIIKLVNFSDLIEFDKWDGNFWVGLSDRIETFRKEGMAETLKKIANIAEKIGEKNYNILKRDLETKHSWNVPGFEIVSNINKLKMKTHTKSKSTYIILLDLLETGVAQRRKKLEADIVSLQKELDKLV